MAPFLLRTGDGELAVAVCAREQSVEPELVSPSLLYKMKGVPGGPATERGPRGHFRAVPARVEQPNTSPGATRKLPDERGGKIGQLTEYRIRRLGAGGPRQALV